MRFPGHERSQHRLDAAASQLVQKTDAKEVSPVTLQLNRLLYPHLLPVYCPSPVTEAGSEDASSKDRLQRVSEKLGSDDRESKPLLLLPLLLPFAALLREPLTTYTSTTGAAASPSETQRRPKASTHSSDRTPRISGTENVF